MVRTTRKIERVAAVRRGRPHLYGGVLALLAALWLTGFVVFTTGNAIAPSPVPPEAEPLGIVVLTGAPNRIQWGMNALTEGRGERLLISGVNELTRPEDLRELVEDPGALFDCCVDLDYSSRNTIANAEEAVTWAAENEFTGVWVVTSYYHMPRALLELRHRDRDLTLYPIRVEPDGYDANNWWYPDTFRILAWEYTKYELALMRIRIATFFGA